jgi:predicted transcriptional regulator
LDRIDIICTAFSADVRHIDIDLKKAGKLVAHIPTNIREGEARGFKEMIYKLCKPHNIEVVDRKRIV